jgi:Nucleotide modification associated domain 1
MKPEEILLAGTKLMKLKNEDYTEGSSRHQNFERSEEIIGWYKNDIDKVYVTLISTKLARLAVLLNKEGNKPVNESIEDSFVDLVNYCALWGSKRII